MTQAPRDAVAVLTGFGRALRGAGVAATPDRVHAMVDAVDALGGMAEPAGVYWAGRLTTCASPDDLLRYDAAFDAYFCDRRELAGLRRPRPPLVRAVALPGEPDRPPAAGDDDASAELVATASALEVLRRRDLATLDGADRALARRLVASLRVDGPTRSSRRRRPAARGGVDPGRTVRAMLRRGGEPARLECRDRTERPRRLVLLLDVSGSMAPYADWMLLFAHAAVRARPGTEVFTLGTRLTRVSRELRGREPEQALRAAGAAVPDWSGGTRLGEELAEFLRRYGRRGTARGAVVVVASDGWERGDPSLLGEQMAWLARLARTVVWVNPHRARPGFTPATAGMQAALPHVDHLVAGHSVAALDELAQLLCTPGGGRRA